MHRGLLAERIILGACSPGQTVATFKDVLVRLRDRLTYLYGDKDRFGWILNLICVGKWKPVRVK